MQAGRDPRNRSVGSDRGAVDPQRGVRHPLSKRDRSLITVASLVTSGSVEQLVGHLQRAKDNGLTEAELKEAIIHLAFYAGWPKAMSAIQVAKRVFAE